VPFDPDGPASCPEVPSDGIMTRRVQDPNLPSPIWRALRSLPADVVLTYLLWGQREMDSPRGRNSHLMQQNRSTAPGLGREAVRHFRRVPRLHGANEGASRPRCEKRSRPRFPRKPGRIHRTFLCETDENGLQKKREASWRAGWRRGALSVPDRTRRRKPDRGVMGSARGRGTGLRADRIAPRKHRSPTREVRRRHSDIARPPPGSGRGGCWRCAGGGPTAAVRPRR